MTELWYRLNFLGEERFFEKKYLVDGIIVPAHLAAYYEIAIPAFLSDLDLPVLIDPMSYLWGISPDFALKKGELKKSYYKLVEKLDCKIANILGKGRIQRIDKKSAEFQNLIKSFLKVQLLGEELQKTPRGRSMERIKSYQAKAEQEKTTPIEHYALIPPYFYFNNVVGNPYQKTVFAAEIAEESEYSKAYKICPCLCMDRTVLREEAQQDKVIKDFEDYSEVILWVSNLDENEAHLNELKAFVNLISKFRETKTDVVNSYGGYFSLILNHLGLSKLSCGICYSHRKDVFAEPGGGGLPIRYYEPHLKLKLLADDMFKLYLDTPELFACKCPICSEYSERYASIQSRVEREQILKEFFGVTGKSREMAEEVVVDWENSRLHFLHVRKTEQAFCEKNPLDKIISDLREKYDLLRRNRIDPARYRFDSFEHLRLWADSLEESS